MIKLESKSALPSATAVMDIRSYGETPSISLRTEEVRAAVKQQDGSEKWENSKEKRKQLVSFIGADGQACELDGTVLDSTAVEMAAAYRVVLILKVTNELKAAYEKGRVSKGYTSLELLGVAEVWSDAKTCVHRSGAPIAAGKEVDMTASKIQRPAA